MAEVNFIYENFLNNKATYNFNRGYWKKQLFNKLGLEFEDFNDYIVYKTLDGHRFYDGNPMFSHLNPSKKKGFRIIQENPQDIKEKDLDIEKFEFVQYWSSELDLGGNLTFEELVISVYLTTESSKLVIDLIKEWYEI